jgi:hypothetical protein
VTTSFRSVPRGRALEGVLKCMRPGRNVLTATARGVQPGKLGLDNHPVTGPLFAGPHERPFICDTAAFTTVTGSKLGAPIDANC